MKTKSSAMALLANISSSTPESESAAWEQDHDVQPTVRHRLERATARGGRGQRMMTWGEGKARETMQLQP
eukprot:3240846-Rhodomonas_salina.1